MTADEITRKQWEAFNSHDATQFASVYAPEATVYDPQYPEPLKGIGAIEKDMQDFFASFGDIKGEIVQVLANGDTFAYEGKAAGTHTGPLPLPTGHVPATNRRMEFGVAGFARLDGQGRIVEERRYYDLAGVLSQLGLMQ